MPNCKAIFKAIEISYYIRKIEGQNSHNFKFHRIRTSGLEVMKFERQRKFSKFEKNRSGSEKCFCAESSHAETTKR